MWKIILMCVIVGAAAKSNKRYDNYKLFTITPTTEKLLNALRYLRKLKGFRFSEKRLSLNKTVNILIKPNKLVDYYNLTFEMNAPYTVLHNNVQQWIDKNGNNLTELMYRFEQSSQISFNRFYTLDEIYEYLDILAAHYPAVQTIVGGHTFENREIKGVKVSFKTNNPGIFIEGGIHSNQWISPATVMYILYELLTNKNIDVIKLAEKHDWYIFPVFNPDGYEYTHTTNRHWSKSRKFYVNLPCFGANLDMNWNVWNSSKNSCNM